MTSRFRRFRAEGLRDYPLDSRPSKVNVGQLARVPADGSMAAFLDSLPDVLAVRELRDLSARIKKARKAGRGILWGFGGHVVKVGLTPLLVQLMKRGYVTALATNGSGMIHDFELALVGKTSEDVEGRLADGSFGMARETGELLNRAIIRGVEQEKGIGESAGSLLEELKPRFPEHSLLLQSHRREVPFTVHVALGTDTIHFHPAASGAALGRGSLIDFDIFAHQVTLLDGGGVYLNLGSAVILPEVFLKAVTLVRNAGRPLSDFTTANLDFIQHYRPLQNVLRRPVAGSGRGIALTGHHELTVPLLAAVLLSSEDQE